MLGYLAAQTSRIILSTSTTLITTNDPVKIAEDYAMLQHLSDGRMDLMLGRGNTAPVYPWFGKDGRQALPLTVENYGLLRQLWDKRLLYEGHRVVPDCDRCGAALSSHEVAQGYKDVDDPSIYVRFPLTDDPTLSLLVWTTTPWTLPSNQAAAIHPNVTYAEVDAGGDRLNVAKALVEKAFGEGVQAVRGHAAAAARNARA